MIEEGSSNATSKSGLSGLVDALRNLVMNRLDLAVLELSEARAAFFDLIVAYSLGLVALLLALGYGTALIVALTWHSLGWSVLALIGLTFAAGGAIAFRRARTIILSGRLSLPSTMHELRKDQETILS